MRLKGNRLWIYPLPTPNSESTTTAAPCGQDSTGSGSNIDSVEDRAKTDDTEIHNKSLSGRNRTLDEINDSATNADDDTEPSTTIGMLKALIQNLPAMANVTIQEIDLSGIEITQRLADYVIRLLQFGNVERLAILLCPCGDPNRIRRIIETALHYNLKQLEWQETPNTLQSISPKSLTERKVAFASCGVSNQDGTVRHQKHLSTVRLNIRMPSHHHNRKRRTQDGTSSSSTSWFLNDLFATTGALATVASAPGRLPNVLTIQHLFLNGSCLDPPALLALGSWIRQQRNMLETLSLKWCRLDDNDVANLVSNFFSITQEVTEEESVGHEQNMLTTSSRSWMSLNDDSKFSVLQRQ